MRVVITCGGTGGHIYPAISLADALREKENAEVLFIGTPNHMEATIIPNANYRFEAIEAEGFNGGLIHKGYAALRMLGSINKARKIIQDFKADIVVGFGGYVSAPVIEGARLLNVPVVLHEQNAFAGRANRFLERFADAVVICYEYVRKQFKKPVYLLGNPRTYAALKHESVDAKKMYGLDERPLVLFVMGSQGSESVNKLMPEVLKKCSGKDYQVLYVTGKKHVGEMNPSDYGANVHFEPYVDQVGLLPQVDLIVTRGGATTASEIGVFKVASIIIPSPYVPNNHQELNAKALSDIGAARLVKEKEITAEGLFSEIDALMNDPETRKDMAEKAGQIGYPNAALDMIELMKDILNGRK